MTESDQLPRSFVRETTEDSNVHSAVLAVSSRAPGWIKSSTLAQLCGKSVDFIFESGTPIPEVARPNLGPSAPVILGDKQTQSLEKFGGLAVRFQGCEEQEQIQARLASLALVLHGPLSKNLPLRTQLKRVKSLAAMLVACTGLVKRTQHVLAHLVISGSLAPFVRKIRILAHVIVALLPGGFLVLGEVNVLFVPN